MYKQKYLIRIFLEKDVQNTLNIQIYSDYLNVLLNTTN